MAREFQPDLGVTGAQGVPQGGSRQVDYSGLASAIGGLFAPEPAANKKAEQEAFEAQVGSNVLTSLMAMESRVKEADFATQELSRTREQLLSDGIISEDEAETSKSLDKEFERLRKFKQQGLGNEFVYRSRVNNLFSRALAEAPGLYKDLWNKWEGKTTQVPEAVTEQGKAANQLFSHVESVYGPNYTERDVQATIYRNRKLAEFTERGQLANISSGRIAIEAGQMVHIAAGDIMTKWKTIADQQGGVYTPEQEAQIQADLMNLKGRADTIMRNMVLEAEAQGAQFKLSDIEGIKKAYQEEFDYLQELPKGKDFKTKLQYYVDTQNLAFQSQEPLLLKVFRSVDQTAGVGGLNALLSIMGDERLQDIITKSGKGFIEDFGFTKDQLISRMFNLMVGGLEINDPQYKKMEATMNSIILKNQVFEPSSKGWTKFVDQVGRDENGEILPDNIPGAVRSLKALDANQKSNFVKGLGEQERRRIKTMSQDWLDKATQDTVAFLDTQDPVGGFVDIVFSEKEGKFVSTLTRMQDRPDIQQSGLARRSQSKAKVLNDLLDLSRDPAYTDLVVNTKEVINFTKRRLDSWRQEQQRQRETSTKK